MRDTTRRAVPAAHGDLDVPELSLVVVHGIGSQADGATAREWAESAVELLTRSGTPARITEVVPPGIGAPPAYTVEVNPPGVVAGLPVVRLQFVDAYWANAFPAPGIKRVVRWLFTLGPNLAIAQAVLSAHRDVRPHPPSATGAAAGVVRRWGALTRILPVTFQLGAVALVAAYHWSHLAAWGRWTPQVGPVDAVAVVVDRWLTWATGLLTPAGARCCTSASPVAGALMVTIVAAVLASFIWRAIAAVQRQSHARWLATGLVERSVVQLSWPVVAVVLVWCALAILAVVVLAGGPPGA